MTFNPGMTRTADSNHPNSALAGTLVVELGSRIGAGVCGSLLAQLGATVVLVEDGGRAKPGTKIAHRAQFAAGKLSILSNPADLDLILDLIDRSDAIITSTDVDPDFLPAEAARRSVVCDITAYGRTGVLAGRPDSELQIQAVSGIMETTGMSDGEPTPIPFPVVEFLTGVYAAASTVAALRAGAGQAIDMALYDCAFAAMATFLPRVLAGDTEPIKRIGNRHMMISPWNVYQAADGWILICVGNDAQWQRLCAVMARPELAHDARFAKTADRVAQGAVTDQIVATWACDHTTAECLTILSEIQIACGPVARIDEYPREANLEFRGMIQRVTDPVRDAPIFLPASPLRMTVSPGRSPDHISEPGGDLDLIKDLISARSSETQKVCLRPMTRAALAGVRVIEIGHYTTAPLSTRVLASLGAEVIKIEPPEGEATRDWPPAQDGQGIFFTYMNSDKRSMVLDLRLDSDAAVLRELLKDADILIENLKPGALSRRGFSPRALSDLNPKLIYCSVSGFGSHSLYAGRPAYDTVIQAMSGVMDAVQSNGVPVKTGISSADLMGAEFAVLALLAALAYRDRTGQGQSIDLSMQDISAWMTQTLWNEGDHSEKAAHVIPCSDGFVLIEGEEASKIAVEASSLTRSELLLQLERLQVPSAPVLTVHEMMAAEQTESRNLWFSVTEEGKTWPLMASPMRLLGTPPEVRHPMPSLGRDTAEIERSLRAHETVT